MSGAVKVEKKIITPMRIRSLILIVSNERRIKGEMVIPLIAMMIRSAPDSIPTSKSITIASPRNLPMRNSCLSIGFERMR